VDTEATSSASSSRSLGKDSAGVSQAMRSLFGLRADFREKLTVRLRTQIETQQTQRRQI
jgi:hypothetical protein